MTKVQLKTFSSLALLTLAILLSNQPNAFAQVAPAVAPQPTTTATQPTTTDDTSADNKRSDNTKTPSASPQRANAAAVAPPATAGATTTPATAPATADASQTVESSPLAEASGVEASKVEVAGGVRSGFLTFKPEGLKASASMNWNSASNVVPQTTSARTPLTVGEKMRFAAKNAFITPQAFLFPAFNAVITQWGEDSQPHKTTEDEVADGLSRFAINYGKRSSKVFLSNGVYASLFRQDPRYRPSGKKGFGARAAHAVARVFVTDSDEGKTQPNYSRFAGSFTASALANLYERSTPGHDRIGADATFKRFYKGFITDAFTNLIFREFWPDIRGIFGR